jgi:hypothetical protein
VLTFAGRANILAKAVMSLFQFPRRVIDLRLGDHSRLRGGLFMGLSSDKAFLTSVGVARGDLGPANFKSGLSGVMGISVVKTEGQVRFLRRPANL